MSVEAHPNLHAVGLTVDIIEAVEQRVRGKAAQLSPADRMTVINAALQAFVTKVSTLLDHRVDR